MNSAIEKDQQKQSGTFAIKTSTQNLFENSGNRITSNSNIQYKSTDVLRNGLFYQKKLGASINEKSNDTVLSQCNEQANKRRISSQESFFGIEATPFDLPEKFV